ncbi:transposase [Salinibacter ruber]|uniref:transposase n=1 Tax=Salinibacter ruber TaxID=146919 RepID=UPI00216A050E|nr:transposase [Salinibacter ruber]
MSNTNVSNPFCRRLRAGAARTTTTERSRAASSRPERSGAPWRNMPERHGNWKTAYDRFRRWAEDGTLESDAWHLQGELDAEGRIDWSQLGSCSTIVQAARAAVGGPNDSKKGIEPGETRG